MPDAPTKSITPRQFYDALVAADVLRPGEHVRRVVIDAAFDAPLVTVYVERTGDERLLNVVPTLAGVEVTTCR